MATRIGWVDNPYRRRYEDWLPRIPEYGRLARELTSSLEAQAPQSSDWADPMLRRGIQEAMRSGMGGGEEQQQRRAIGDAYRSAVGAGGFAGGAAGSFSPRAVNRLAGREAATTLAPAMAGLEAKKEAMQRQGRATGLSALTTAYPVQQRAAEARRGEFGQLLGGMLQGSGLDRRRRSESGPPAPWQSAGRSW